MSDEKPYPIAFDEDGNLAVDLKALAKEKYLKIVLDESAKIDKVRANRVWYYQVPCRYGHIYVHGADSLGAFTDRSKVRTRLAKLGRVHQNGDVEMTVVFDPCKLDEVASLLQAKKRRTLSESERERLRSVSGLPTVRRSTTSVDVSLGSKA